MFTSSGGGLSAELRRRIFNQSRYDIKIVAVDAKKSAQAEIFSNKFKVVPNGFDENYSYKIANIVDQYNVNLVIPCSDEEALNLSKNRRIIEGLNCKLACAEYDILKIISNKLNTSADIQILLKVFSHFSLLILFSAFIIAEKPISTLL